MDKLKMQTPSLADEHFAALAAMFPNAVTETIDENGIVVRAIDKDVLTQEINAHVVEGREERYQFTWPDKKKAILAANAPISSALRPCKEESVDFDNTENLYIEGDNLDVLKLLQETYLGKVKMIYIDPPYNTGSDFIYNDDFAQSADEYLDKSGQYDADGNRLVQNTESNGRFHTDWLNMMYPRLKLAKDLLTNDGVIFISIDDNEHDNLKKCCDEVFGLSNFVTTIHCQLSTTQGMKVKAAQDGNIVKNAEYVLIYSKDGHKDIARNTPLYDLRPNYDEHYSLFLKKNGEIGQLSELYNYKFPKDCSNKRPFKLAEAYNKSEEFADIVRSHLADIVCSDKVTGFDISTSLKNGFWKEVERNNKKYLLTLDRNNSVRQLLRLEDSWGNTDGFYEEKGLRKIRGDWWDGFYIDMGNVSKEGGVDFKNGKKPVRLVKQLAKLLTKSNDLILDFFSGSATTAHAVMQLNTEDGGHRKFIMVQLPEKTDEKSEAYKAGYKNICEIGKERIRRAGKKIKEEAGLSGQDLDIGFRVLKLDSSNMKDVYYTPDELLTAAQKQQSIFGFMDNIKEDRSPEDLLFQVMLELNIPLSAKIIQDGDVFYVNDNHLIACFNQVDNATITEIAQKKPYCVVFRDSSFLSDSAMINFEQIFNTYSPSTKRRVL